MKVAEMVVKVACELGHMFDDPAYLASTTQPDNKGSPVTPTELNAGLQSLIDEQTGSVQIKTANLDQMLNDINSYFDDPVSTDKSKLIDEMKAAAAVEMLAAAAAAGSELASVVPGAAFVLGATSVALFAVQMGLEIAIDKLEGELVPEINFADSNIRERFATDFAPVEAYQQALSKNLLFFPRLRLGISLLHARSLFMGSILLVRKANNGQATPDLLKAYFVNIYKLSQAQPELVAKYIEILQRLSENDPNAIKQFENLMEGEESWPKFVLGGFGWAFSFALTAEKGIKYFADRAAVFQRVASAEIELQGLGDDLEVVEPEVAVEAEGRIAGRCGSAINVLGALVIVATLVYGIWRETQIGKLEQDLDESIDKARAGLREYYTTLVNAFKSE